MEVRVGLGGLRATGGLKGERLDIGEGCLFWAEEVDAMGFFMG